MHLRHILWDILIVRGGGELLLTSSKNFWFRTCSGFLFSKRRNLKVIKTISLLFNKIRANFRTESPMIKEKQSAKCKVQSAKSKVQSPKSKVQSAKCKVQKVQSPKCKKCKIQSPKCKKCKIQSPKCKVQSPK